jgi:pilus assembly protein TadC
VSEELTYSGLAIATTLGAVALIGSLLVMILDFMRNAKKRPGILGPTFVRVSHADLVWLPIAGLLIGEILVLQVFTKGGAPVALLSVGGVALAASLWQTYRKRKSRVQAPHVAELISVFYTTYLTHPTVMEALKLAAANIGDARLGNELRRCVDSFYSGCTLEESLERMSENVQHPLCTQFVSILKDSSRVSATALTESLCLLKERAGYQQSARGNHVRQNIQPAALVLMLIVFALLASNTVRSL